MQTTGRLSPVWPGTGDPLGRDLADEETVAGAAHVLLPCWGVLNRLQRETEEQEGHEKTEGQAGRVADKTSSGRREYSITRERSLHQQQLPSAAASISSSLL